MVLPEVVLDTYADVGIVEDVVETVVTSALIAVVRCVGMVVAIVCELPFHLGRESGGWCLRQITGLDGLVELSRINHGEGGTDVELMDGVDVNTGLEAFQQRVALGVVESAVGILGLTGSHIVDVGDVSGKDIVLYAIDKQGEFGGEIASVVVEAQVSLPAVLGTKVGIAYLVAKRAMVNAVAAQFAEVRGAKATGCIGTDVNVIIDVIDSAERTAQGFEIA